MSRFPTWTLALALAPLAACSNTPTPISTTAPIVMPSPVLSPQDQAFLDAAGASDQFEISSAQLALQKTQNPAVRRFAQRMVDDHSKTTQQLSAIAQAKGTTLQPKLTSDEAGMLEGMQSTNGRAFLGNYERGAVTSHRDAVTLFQNEIANGSDPDLKAFAQQTLPVIQDHLAMARRLR